MRYYAAFDDVPKIFATTHKRAWMVFDRCITTTQGNTLPILLCTNRHIAFNTRDALNAQEERK